MSKPISYDAQVSSHKLTRWGFAASSKLKRCRFCNGECVVSGVCSGCGVVNK